MYFDKIAHFFQIYTSHRGLAAQFLEINKSILDELIEIGNRIQMNCRLYFFENKLIFEIFGNYEWYVETVCQGLSFASFEKDFDDIYADFENLRQLVELLTKIRLNDANEFV